MRILLTFVSFLLTCVVMAQSASITTTQTSYNYGETVVIQYEGAANGDKILFYQDLSMLPLKVCFSLSEPNGTCKVKSLLEPGRYKAQIVDAADVATAEVQFIVNHATLPTGGKKIFLFSDPHVMSPDLVEAPNSPSYIRDVADSRKLMAYSAELFDAVIDSIKTMKPDLVIIPGDMSKDGELLSHQYVAQRLHELKDMGIPTLVIPGNHDMECKVGVVYKEDKPYLAENVTIPQFKEIYKDFGWGEGSDCDDNSLTYACEPIPGLRVIGIDDCKTYSRGWTSEGQGEYGCIPSHTLEWILQQADNAVANNKVPIAVIHHQMLTHFIGQDEFQSASLDQGDSIARVFLDHGIRLVLTGHMHMPDISKIWNQERTDSLVEISSGSPDSYPCQYKILSLDDNVYTMEVETRYITSIASIEDVQAYSRQQISTSLRGSVRKLVRSYLPKLQRVINQYSSLDPALAEVLLDIPMTTDELTSIVIQAFRPVMEKVIFTHCEGNENLKIAEEELVAEFNDACWVACDLVFDNQDEDTKAFMFTLMQSQMQSRNVETMLRSMMSDLAYYGQPDQSQDNDLYYTVHLRHDPSGIQPVTPICVNDGEIIYNLAGQKLSPTQLQHKGIYIIKKDGQTKKVMMK